MKMTKDNVLIKIHQRPEVTKGGIVLPQEKELKNDPKGTVIAVGPAVRELVAGDEVLFGMYAGHELKIKGVPHIILRELDILAKETPE